MEEPHTEAHTALPDTSKDIFWLFFLSHKERRYCLSIWHRLIASKHLYIRTERNAMNDGTMILWISSQISTLLITHAQYRITVWQLITPVPLQIKVLVFPWPLEPWTPYILSTHSLTSSSKFRKHKLWATKSAHTFSCATEAQGIRYKNNYTNTQLTEDPESNIQLCR